MHVLLAWELGANLGHVMPLRLLAQGLLASGHRVSFALRDTAMAEQAIEHGLGPVFQAPIPVGVSRNPVARQLSYASLLHNCGYDEPVGLASRIRGWRTLMQGLRCDRLIADHAPTALLAARTLGIPAFNVGSGFQIPPPSRPYPPYEDGRPPQPGQLERNEAIVLSTLNQALARLQLPTAQSLQAALQGSGAAVASYAELDAYQLPRPEPYVGVPDFASGARPLWPEPRAPRLFAYLRPFKQLPRVLDALRRSPAHVLVRVAEIPAARLQQYARPNLLITEQSVHMREVAASCDAYLNYAAHGTVAEMLLAGKPGLLLPNTVERGLVARRAAAMGAALVPPDPETADFPALLEQLLGDTRLRLGAQAFAQRHAADDRAGIVARVLDLALQGLPLPP